MRIALYAMAILGLASLGNVDNLRAALATSVSALLEATPFIFAGAAMESLVPRAKALIAYLGCGCTAGPSARSIPAAAATWFAFGPIVAVGRFAAASLVAALVWRRIEGSNVAVARAQPLHEIATLAPAAVLAAALTHLFNAFASVRLGVATTAAIGAALGFTAPCALGAVALAGTLRAHAPAAMVAFLCVAGVIDLRALRAARCSAPRPHDGFAYALLGFALAGVAFRHGAALVHPMFTGALAICAAVAFACSVIFRRQRCSRARIAPALMLSGTLIGAPPPAYHATETTLSALFAGEELQFSGVLSCDVSRCSLIRYAITCCRADAAPVVVAVTGVPRRFDGRWLRVEGNIANVGREFTLIPRRVEVIAAPSDPFIYR